MSHLTYTNYEGYGELAKESYWYSQAVRVGDVIELSGQGKFLLPSIPKTRSSSQMFANAHLNQTKHSPQEDGTAKQIKPPQTLTHRLCEHSTTLSTPLRLQVHGAGKMCSPSAPITLL